MTSRNGEWTPLLERPSADRRERELSPARIRLILGATWVGVFLGAFDGTVVATLLSSISSSFHSSNQQSWLGTSYLLSTAVFTPLYGRFCDIVGRKNAALTALALFGVGTLLCGLASSMNMLIVARLIAGMGGGGMMSVSSIIASDIIPLRNRGLVQGMANICFGMGAGLGAPIGGWISDTVGWRFAFLIQVPVIALSATLVFSLVDYAVPSQSKSKMETLKRIDWAGSATLCIALSSLLLGLSFKNNELLPWSSPKVYGFMLAFLIGAGLFIISETWISPEPVMPMRLLRQRSPLYIALANFFTSMVTFSILFFFPMYFETVKLLTPAETGLHMIPNAVALSIGSLVAGYIMRKTGHYYWLTVVLAISPLITLVSLANFDENTSGVTWFIPFPSGIGFGGCITSLLIALVSAVDRSDMAVATGLSYLARYLGQVIGVALSSAVLQSVLNRQLHQRITGDGAEEIIEKIRHVSSSVLDLPESLKTAAVHSYSAALKRVWWLNIGLAIACVLCTLPIREYALPSSFEEEDSRKNGNSVRE